MDPGKTNVTLPVGIVPNGVTASRNNPRLVTAVLLGIMLLIAGFGLGLLGLMKSSDVYVGALARVRASPVAQSLLGLPIKDGYFLRGRIKTGPTTGAAKLQVSLTGPKGRGTLEIVATKTGGEWHYSHLGLNLGGQVTELAGPER